MADSHTRPRRVPLEDLPLDLFLPTPRPDKRSTSSPTKRRILAEESIVMTSSPSTSRIIVNSPPSSLPMKLHFGPPTSSPRTPDKCNLSMSSSQKHRIRAEDGISITSSPSTTRITVSSHMFPDSSLPTFRLPTSSPTRPDKCNLSMRTPTKRQILEEDSILSSPSTTRIAVTSHESPGISLPLKRHFRLPTDSATTPPGIRTFAIADVSIFTASESTPPTSTSQRRCTDFSGIQSARQPQSIHYPGFDVFVDAARTVRLNALMNEAFDAQTTDILAAGSDQDEEKENIE
ncbi:hypothetical protein B0H13DRAFT_2303358 [Mycena leptocephala]|nr:hypothetical protein B0H13DRAFT_2303358 [Mycena leptocephala]